MRTAAVFCVLLATGAHNAALETGSPVGHLPSCASASAPGNDAISPAASAPAVAGLSCAATMAACR